MRLALVTTTINVPEVLTLYRALRSEVAIIVTGDERTPNEAARRLVASLDNAVYLDKEEQQRLGYTCSQLIGWNTVQRRNIAVLEAMKLRPDVIVTVDDDNIPVSPKYFAEIEEVFTNDYRGLCVEGSDQRWFNAGDLLSPPVFHRGFPFELRHASHEPRMRGVANARVGISAGLWTGDPDVDAMNRVVGRPTVHHWSGLVDNGVLVARGCYAPFNSQNTAFRSKFAALMMVWVGVGRYDDIWASYVAERVLRDTEYHVRFGGPLVWQQRNVQSHWVNLRDEMLGMEATLAFTRALDRIDLGDGEPVERLRRVFSGLLGCSFIPRVTLDAGLAWCHDFESVVRV